MSKDKSGLLGRLFGQKAPEPPPPPPQPVRYTPPVRWPKSISQYKLEIPVRIGEKKRRYAFKSLHASFTSNTWEPGTPLNLRTDGSIYVAGEKAGSYDFPRLQGMLTDWYSRGDPVIAKLLQMNEDGSAFVYAAFYQTPNYTREKVCRVFGTGNAEAQETLFSLSPGDALYLSEDEGLVNVGYSLFDLGYLGKADAEWAVEELNLDFCEVTVDSVEPNDGGKMVLRVKIRY